MNEEKIAKALDMLGKCGVAVAGDLVLEKHVDKEIGNVESGGIGIMINGREVATDNEETEAGTDLVEKLKPIFYNNEDDVRLFLKEIIGMNPNNITDLVNTWVQDKRISNYGNSRKGDLWQILNDAGLYTKSRQNWNRRVY